METEVLVKPEIRDLVVHNGHYYIVIVASIISFAVTQIAKPFIKSTCDDKANAITRAFAVIAGAVIGWSIAQDIIDLWLGAAAGGANAFIVKMMKKKAQAHLGVSVTPASEAASEAASESEES
jgi:hypothetical protein